MNEFRYRVSLRIFSKTADLEAVCVLLGLRPKWLNKMGAPRINPKGMDLGGVYEVSYCCVDFSVNENELLGEMLGRVAIGLENNKSIFQSIRREGGRVEFFIGWFSTGNTGETLDFELLKKLGELGIDLALDVYGEGTT